MKILIHSNGPMVPSGYGQQVKLLAPRLKAAGHDVAISAFYGLSGSPILWEGIPIFPAGGRDYGTDVIVSHARNHGADVVITLMDFWKLAPIADQLRNLNVLAWLPIDTYPLGRPDRRTLRDSGARAVAMSRFGQDRLTEAGFASAYAPHAVDTGVFKPPEDRQGLRRELGLDDFFLIGICAANSDALRKAWPEQFYAFSQFARVRDDARLMVHTRVHAAGGFPLLQLADDMGIADKIIWSDQYAQTAGLMTEAMMADWYGTLDMLSACSYAEGFGVPIVEAQACGTPVVSGTTSAMLEVNVTGESVTGDLWWNPVHRAWWERPRMDKIYDAYVFNYENRGRRVNAERVAHFDADRVVAEHWLSILDGLAAVEEMDVVSTYPAELTGGQ